MLFSIILKSIKQQHRSNNNNSTMSQSPNNTKKTLTWAAKTAAVLQKKGYTIQEMLSEGAFGQVFKGRLNREKDMKKTGDTASPTSLSKSSPSSSEEIVAIKVMFLENLGKNYIKKFWPRELFALTEIRHPHIIEVYDIFRSGGKLFICMEFADGGDMTGYMSARQSPLSEPIACYWFTHCCLALEYMHDEHYIAHRDIKLDNVLLKNNKVLNNVISSSKSRIIIIYKNIIGQDDRFWFCTNVLGRPKATIRNVENNLRHSSVLFATDLTTTDV